MHVISLYEFMKLCTVIARSGIVTLRVPDHRASCFCYRKPCLEMKTRAVIAMVIFQYFLSWVSSHPKYKVLTAELSTLYSFIDRKKKKECHFILLWTVVQVPKNFEKCLRALVFSEKAWFCLWEKSVGSTRRKLHCCYLSIQNNSCPGIKQVTTRNFSGDFWKQFLCIWTPRMLCLCQMEDDLNF